MDEVIVNFGGELKALDNGHFGGYLVRFSDAQSPDLAGDYFTKETDFGISDGAKTPVYFHHRQPLKTRDDQSIVIKAKIGEATLSIDDEGVLVDAIIFNREKYEKAISKAGRARKADGGAYLGWSSGTAPHLCDREKKGGANFIKFWQLGADASLTPTPCEPVNDVVPLKALTTIKFLPLDEFEVLVDEALEKPAAKSVDGAALFNESLRQREMRCWELTDALNTGARKVVDGAAAENVTGVQVNVREAMTALVLAFAPNWAEAATAQAEEWLQSDRSDSFYLKSVFDALTSEDEGARAASKFSDHLEVVLAAAREVTERAKQIQELRVKAGRVLSEANRTRLAKLLDSLQTCAGDIEALLGETEPKVEKFADPDLLRGLAAEFAVTQRRLHRVTRS